jgi:hypothetical protein
VFNFTSSIMPPIACISTTMHSHMARALFWDSEFRWRLLCRRAYPGMLCSTIYMHGNMHVLVHVNVYLYLHVHVLVHVHVHVHVNVNVYVHVYVYVYVTLRPSVSAVRDAIACDRCVPVDALRVTFDNRSMCVVVVYLPTDFV